MNVFLLNVHCPQNAGDLALLQQSLWQIKHALPQSIVTYAINEPEPLEWLPCGIEHVLSLHHCKTQTTIKYPKPCRKWLMIGIVVWLMVISVVYRWFNLKLLPRHQHWRALLVQYLDAQVTFAVGGGYLYSARSFDLNYFWVWFGLAIPIIMGKPLILLPQSFGPIEGRVNRWLLRWLVNHATCVYSREEISRQFLVSLGVRRAIRVVPDVAFHTQKLVDNSQPTSTSDTSITTIGMTVMDFGLQYAGFQRQVDYDHAIIATIQHFIQQPKTKIVLFTQCTGATPAEDDRIIARRIKSYFQHDTTVEIVDQALKPEELRLCYQHVDVLVATRLHSAIFAMSMNVPVVVIGYLYKSQGIMAMMGLSSFQCDISRVTAQDLIAKTETILANQTTIRLAIQERMQIIINELTRLPHQIRLCILEQQ